MRDTTGEIHQEGLFCSQNPINEQRCKMAVFHVPIVEEGGCVAILQLLFEGATGKVLFASLAGSVERGRMIKSCKLAMNSKRRKQQSPKPEPAKDMMMRRILMISEMQRAKLLQHQKEPSPLTSVLLLCDHPPGRWVLHQPNAQMTHLCQWDPQVSTPSRLPKKVQRNFSKNQIA